MEIEPSQPVLDSYVGGDSNHDNKEEAEESSDGMIDEEMVSLQVLFKHYFYIVLPALSLIL